MKKILLIMMSMVIVAPSSILVVSCGSKVIPNMPIIVTDGGKINDKSFNESSLDGINEFIETNAEGVDGSHNYVEALDDTTDSLWNAYLAATLLDASSIVVSGFSHANTLTGYNSVTQTAAKNNSNVVALDLTSDTQFNLNADAETITIPYEDTYEGQTNPVSGGASHEINIVGTGETESNLVGASFNTEIAAVYCGISVSAYLNVINSDDTKLHNLVGMFGGILNKYSVNNFIWGFMVGAQIWNQNIQSDENSDEWNEMIDTFGLTDKKLIPTMISNGSNLQGTPSEIAANPGLNSDWSTNSFALGDGRAKSQELHYENADAAMAVAGPQTQDLIDAGIPNIIGVDTDQSQVYNGGNFITSIKKDLTTAAYDLLQCVDPSGSLYEQNHDKVLQQHVTSNDWVTLATSEVENTPGGNSLTTAQFNSVKNLFTSDQMQAIHEFYVEIDSESLVDAIKLVPDVVNEVLPSHNEKGMVN